jgi:hypothetical protein
MKHTKYSSKSTSAAQCNAHQPGVLQLTTTVAMSASMLSLRLNQPLLMASATQPRLQNSSTSLHNNT